MPGLTPRVGLQERVHLGLVYARESTRGHGGEQVGSGQFEVARAVVSRPRNHFTCWYGTPMLSENSPLADRSVRAVHQYVPDEVSVYWL